MTNRRLMTLFFLALIGYGGLFLLLRGANPAARWNFRTDRATAIEIARSAAASYGYAAPIQTEDVWMDFREEEEYYLAHKDNPLLGSLLTSHKTTVKLSDPGSGSGFEAQINARGELLGYRLRERREKREAEKKEADGQPLTPDAPASDRRVADEALRRFLGERYGEFSFIADSSSGDGERKFSWMAADEGLKVMADVIVRGGKVREVWLQSNPTPKLLEEFSRQRGAAMEILSNTEIIWLWPAVILMIVFYFVSLARRRIDHRQTLTFLVCLFLLLLVSNLPGSHAGGLLYSLRFNINSSIYRAGYVIQWTIIIAIYLITAALLYLFLATGLALASGTRNRKTIDLELLLKGKLLRRPVAASLVAGLAAGGSLAMIAHAVVATGLFPGASVDARNLDDAFIAIAPALDSILFDKQYLIFISFAFLIPATEAFVKRPWFRQGLILAIAFMTMTDMGPLLTSTPALVVTSLLQAYLLVWLYHDFGLLAAMVSTTASHLALSSAALSAQPSPSLQASGHHALIGLGIAMVAALIGYWRSSEATEEEVAVKAPPESGDERERLQAEFSVARKAQLRMLPARPPAVPGLAIAAVCRPSREVGGDLYDFLSLPEGKIGVVIADVSGKGVPASLYMTLTKGLLDSVAEYKADPGEILREVNRRLYEVCRRKIFVTVFLGVIDPSRRTIRFARAGHNPPIVHRNGAAPERKTWMLKPRGMGMGLSDGEIFDRSLQVETMRLERGDKLFFYSDGITEAMNEKRDEYGEERLMAMAEKTAGLDAEQSLDAVMADVAEFLGTLHPQDDQTLVVLQLL